MRRTVFFYWKGMKLINRFFEGLWIRISKIINLQNNCITFCKEKEGKGRKGRKKNKKREKEQVPPPTPDLSGSYFFVNFFLCLVVTKKCVSSLNARIYFSKKIPKPLTFPFTNVSAAPEVMNLFSHLPPEVQHHEVCQLPANLSIQAQSIT